MERTLENGAWLFEKNKRKAPAKIWTFNPKVFFHGREFREMNRKFLEIHGGHGLINYRYRGGGGS